LIVSYDERLSKTYSINLRNRFQDEHFRPLVISRDPDVDKTFTTLFQHMPTQSKDGHLFLSPIHNHRGKIWFKENVNVGESTMRTWMKLMAKNASISGDITNKCGRVTSITRMLAARVPPEVIASITGHRNLRTLAKYDRVVLLKARAAQKLLRLSYNPETGSLNDFDEFYAREMQEYNRNQLGLNGTQDVSEIGDLEEDDPNDFSAFLDDGVQAYGTIDASLNSSLQAGNISE
jgi:hypothetical protein